MFDRDCFRRVRLNDKPPAAALSRLDKDQEYPPRKIRGKARRRRRRSRRWARLYSTLISERCGGKGCKDGDDSQETDSKKSETKLFLHDDLLFNVNHNHSEVIGCHSWTRCGCRTARMTSSKTRLTNKASASNVIFVGNGSMKPSLRKTDDGAALPS